MNQPELLSGDNPRHVLRAARILRDGGVVIVPTDTLYGIAASVFQPDAVDRVYRIKDRARERRVPVLLSTATDIPMLAEPPPRVAWKLIGSFWPGALTLVLPAAASAPRGVTQNRGTIALRVPAGKTCLQLLQVLGEPIVGTSANRSGEPPAAEAERAAERLPDVDAVLRDDRGVSGGDPSTVVEVGEGGITVVRQGAISTEAIRMVVGPATAVHEELAPRQTAQ
ncbi:MAG: L-threonylcarbamoyladenylate synthase [Chloroflexota bacterium]